MYIAPMPRAEKARQLRYRKAALSLIQYDRLADELYNIASECDELTWAVDDDEMLLDVFDGDTDEIHEFRMMFADLSADCERLSNALGETCVTEHFDDFFVGSLGNAHKVIGYDSIEEDYFSLTRFEAGLAQGVSGKRLMTLTKEKMIAVAGQCIGVMMCFLDLRHQYDCLKATFDLLRDDRAELIKGVKALEAAYEKTQADKYDYDAQRAFDNILWRLPDRVWIE